MTAKELGESNISSMTIFQSIAEEAMYALLSNPKYINIGEISTAKMAVKYTKALLEELAKE